MRRTFYIFAAVCVLAMPVGAYAQGEFTDALKSIFAETTMITVPEIAVPIVVEVAVPFDSGRGDMHVVVDTTTGTIEPSVVMTENEIESFVMRASTDDAQVQIQNLTDNDLATYAEFTFQEQRDAEGQIVPDTSIFDVLLSRKVTTDALSLILDEHIAVPQKIRIAVVEDDQERVVLPERLMQNSTRVVFPEVTADHFRITLVHSDIVRIRTLKIHENGAPTTISRKIRFLAYPESQYRAYFNADYYVRVNAGEMPNVVGAQDVRVLSVSSPESNTFYHQADTDEDGIVDAEDNCVSVANPDQVDKDQNGKGDLCEDHDRDGIIAAQDNCPLKANRNQSDVDGDGKGDVCDDEESRLLAQYPWLPTATIMLVSAVVILLIVKTLREVKSKA